MVNFFIVEYHENARRAAGSSREDVDIDVVELPICKAVAMIAVGMIRRPKPSCWCNTCTYNEL